ncbi:MAG TPA: hypothetical protein VMR34_01650 [Candidatus Saccharimonadales bacterium]|nr:hypothetical protein [Candidatus Saccharimonadales bacterium]
METTSSEEVPVGDKRQAEVSERVSEFIAYIESLRIKPATTNELSAQRPSDE